MKTDSKEGSLADILHFMGILTYEEAKIYMEILDEKNPDAKTITLRTGLPLRQIYGILNNLEELELITLFAEPEQGFVSGNSETLAQIRISLSTKANYFETFLRNLRKKCKLKDEITETAEIPSRLEKKQHHLPNQKRDPIHQKQVLDTSASGKRRHQIEISFSRINSKYDIYL